jgi:hypothetical protein
VITVALRSSIYEMQPVRFRLLSAMKYWLDHFALNGAWQLQVKLLHAHQETRILHCQLVRLK